MDFLLTQFMNGLVYGSLLFILAAGLSLIFGLMGVINLAHGSFFMLGAFCALSVVAITGSFWWALLLAPVLPALAAGLVETVFLKRLYDRDRLDQVLLTFGFAFIFVDLVKWIWGGDIFNLAEPESLEGAVEIFGGIVPIYRLAILGLGAVVAAGLWLAIEWTPFGAKVRAGVEDRWTALGIGINVPVIFTITFIAGGALAGLAGVAAAPILGVYSDMDTDILIPAFVVIVVGGMGSLRGALVGSLLIGEADTFGKAYLPDLSTFLIYLVMIAILLTRPHGLFARSAEAQ
jgi:branched-chain amino acid transport system permease protein